MRVVGKKIEALALTASAALAGAVLGGCPGTNGGVVTLDELPGRLGPSYCGLFDRCPNPFVASFVFGGQECADVVVPLIEDSFLGRAEDAVRDGTVVYHGDLVSTCLAQLDSSGCDPTAIMVQACSDVFEGTISVGGDCNWDEECIDGYCSMSDGMCPGTCGTRAAVGGSCTMDGGCQAGLECVGGTCQERSGAGEPCEGAEERSCSGIDLACVGSEGTTPGTCRTWSQILSGGVGEPCEIADDLCDDGLSCVFAGVAGGMATFECAAAVAAGADCAQGFPDPCPDDQYCMMGAMPGMGVCTALPTAGMPCTATGSCSPGLRCAVPMGAMAGTCVAPARLGEPCTANAACLSSNCQDGVCATPGC